MSFTKALYYPSIEIQNDLWLKNAILFWDNIYTIVPESMDSPYNTDSQKFLRDEGLLLPFKIASDNTYITDLKTDVIKYMDNEVLNLLSRQISGNTFTYSIHKDKLAEEVKFFLENQKSGDWYSVDQKFSKFYMTLLATKICSNEGFGLLTNSHSSSKLSEKIKLDNQRDLINSNENVANRNNVSLAPGLLIELAIGSVQIKETAKLTDIIKYKNIYGDELGRFRNLITDLTGKLEGDIPYNALLEQINSIYKNEFVPAYQDLQKSLDSMGIDFFNKNLLKTALLSTGSTALLTLLIGVSAPVALLAGAGISLVSSLISYNTEHEQMIRKSPYSYILRLNGEI